MLSTTVSSACAVERDSLTLSTFANFSQREQWKFKQSNVNELIVTLLFLNFLKYFFRTNYLFLSAESSQSGPMSVQMFLVRAVDARQVALSTAISLPMHFGDRKSHVNSPSKASMCWLGPSPSQVSIQYFSQSIFFHNGSNSLENTNTINNFISLIYGAQIVG